MVGISFASNKVAYETSKETFVEGTRLLTKSQEPVTTSTNSIEVSVASVAYLPDVVTSNINHVSFTSSDGASHDRDVAGVDTRAEEHVKIYTTLGDTIEWNGGPALDITMANGDSFTKSIKCSKCSSINLVMNDEIEQGLQEYERVLEEIFPRDQDERRLSALSYGMRGVLDFVSDCAQTCFNNGRSWGGLRLEALDLTNKFKGTCSCGSRDDLMDMDSTNPFEMTIGPITRDEGTDALAYKMHGILDIVSDCAQECFYEKYYSWGGLWLENEGDSGSYVSYFTKFCYCANKVVVMTNNRVQTVIGPIKEETQC